MKRTLILLVLFFSTSILLNAQNDYEYKTAVSKNQILQSGNFGENTSEIFQIDMEKEAPEPGGIDRNKKRIVNNQRREYYSKFRKTDGYKTGENGLLPNVDTSFDGQPNGARGIPNDNNIAVSNSGKIVSVQNSSIRVMDENGKTIMFKSLYAFANGKVQGFTNYCYDPKVIYDQVNDRFVLFFLHESKVVSSFGVLAFSKTNDPSGEWNFYKIPGNPLKNDKWSDYPILAHSADDIFITLNLLSENTDWREGFNQSIIWQISKKSGFKGDTLIQKIFYDIFYKNKAIWSICPVQGGFLPTNPNMYFLSVRPGDIENDTLFVHELNNTLQSGKSILGLKILKTDKKYGLPPEAPQPSGGDTLQTNDCRVLGAIYYNNKIQYVQTSVVKPYIHSGVFHGMFDVKKSTIVKSSIISADTVDYAYPSICYAGNGKNTNQSSVITFSDVSSKSFPGTAAVFHSQVATLPSVFSKILRVKHGESYIERLPYTQVKQERWGDYTGIQLQYNNPEIVWLVGSYGTKYLMNGTWIGKLKVIGNVEIETENELKVFPNPAFSKIAIGINNETERNLIIKIYSEKGQFITELYDGYSSKGYNEFYFDIENFAHGLYILRVFDSGNSEVYSAKFIK